MSLQCDFSIMEGIPSEGKVTSFWIGKDHSYEQSLTEQHQQNCKIKQEIILQRQISSKLAQHFAQHFERLEVEGVQLAGRLEREIKKNEQLTELVEGTEKFVYSVRKRNSELVRLNEDNTEDILPSLIRKERKLEYDIDQLVQKHNESLCAINQAIVTVNAARSQRVIYSGIFNSIEKELFEAEINFKKLMIEKELSQMRLEKQRKAFQKLLRDSEKKQQIETGVIRCNRLLSNIRPDRLGKMSNARRQECSKQKLTTSWHVPEILQEQIGYKQQVVRFILQQTQCADQVEFGKLLNGIDKDNEQLFRQLQQIDAVIGQVEARIKGVRERRKRSELAAEYPRKKNQAIKGLEQTKLKINRDTADIEEEIENYLESITPVLRMVGQPMETDVKQVCEVTCRLQQRLNELLPRQNNRNNKASNKSYPRLTVLIQDCSRTHKPSRLFSRRELEHLSLGKIHKGHSKSRVL